MKHMIKAALAVCALALSLPAYAQTPDSTALDRPRVAVVLSGGGAKGVAHIGVLKVIERAGIPVDIVTGTSMGSIVGGLYALGYDACSLDSIVRRQNWDFLLSDKENLSNQNLADREKQNTYMLTKNFTGKKKDVSQGGFVKGKNLAELFRRLVGQYGDSIDFNTLPIPFACVATDIVTNTEYDFHSGYIAQAMRASMAIPGAFSPVRLGDMVLVDGGLRNNYPADVARAMGADIIIGVTVQGDPRTADDLGSVGSIIGQIVDVNCKNKYDENLAITDLPIRVNTKGYSSASFTPAAIDTLLRRGEEEALRHWDELLALKARLGLSDDYQPLRHSVPQSVGADKKVKLTALSFEGLSQSDERFLLKKFHLAQGDSLDTELAEHITTSMRVDLYYLDASYRIIPQSDAGGVHVIFSAGERKRAQAGVGVRFDTEELVALQLYGGLPLRTKVPAYVEATLRLGKRIMGRIDFSLRPHNLVKPSLSYIFRHNTMDIYERGDKDYNITYNQHAVELTLLNFNLRNLNCTAGVRFDYFNVHDVLISHQVKNSTETIRDDHFFSYFARMAYNSENDWYFPSHGAKFRAQYAYYTDNFARLDGTTGMSEVSASWRMNFPLNSRLTLQPMLCGRLLFGKVKPYFFENVIGGEWDAHYVDQQMPFAGIGRVEYADAHLLSVQLKTTQRIATNNFLLLRLAVAQQAPELKHMFDHRTLLGIAASYYYRTPFGPVGASLGYANKTKKPYFFINLGYVF